MAPDSRFWRHQLGEAATSLRRNMLKATVPLCLFLSLSSNQVEARTEPGMESWSSVTASIVNHERPAPGDPMALASLSPPSAFFNSSPTGRWSDRNQIHIPNQPVIEKYIRFYKGERGRKVIEDALRRSGPYVPVMAQILESCGVPAEMLSIVVVESCFKGHASWRGAGGYWQLLAGTARSMGLRVDRWVDERLDPVKSTMAAARYLRSFYDQYNSWPLALAAYNAGDGVVNSAVRRCGTSDFFKLSVRGGLPGRTRVYVPKVMAAMQIMRDLENNGFEKPGQTPVYDYESIKVSSPLRLEQVAQWIKVSVCDLQAINPSLRADKLPPDCGVELNLPSGARDQFELAYQDFLRN